MRKATLTLNEDHTEWVFIEGDKVEIIDVQEVGDAIKILESLGWEYQWTHANGFEHYLHKV